MSWSIFFTECMALTGMRHVSRTQYARTLATAYHSCVDRHFETMTGGGKITNAQSKYDALYRGFLRMCDQNLGGHAEVNWIAQVGVYCKAYWPGLIIVGPTGIVTVSSQGTWLAPKLKQNFDFRIIIYSLIATARVHIKTVTGTYVSTVLPAVTAPWSGALMVTT